jgi:hypothetical protein
LPYGGKSNKVVNLEKTIAKIGGQGGLLNGFCQAAHAETMGFLMPLDIILLAGEMETFFIKCHQWPGAR